jgi:hypothetical protein
MGPFNILIYVTIIFEINLISLLVYKFIYFSLLVLNFKGLFKGQPSLSQRLPSEKRPPAYNNDNLKLY